jgi:peptide/nickel transport system substrate-binding protein
VDFPFTRWSQILGWKPHHADDVVFSFLRLRDSEESVYSGPFQPIKEVVALDEKTVEFTLDGPAAPFFGSVEMFNAGIVPQAVVEADEAGFAQMPVTTGPYKVREWLPNDRLVLERNEFYWREGYPKIDVVEILEVPNDNTRVSMIKAGEVDVALGVPYANIQEIDSSDEIDVPLDPSSVIEVMLLNHKDPLISDVRIRKAIAHALDVEGITNAVTLGIATPANSPIPNTLLYYYADLRL